MIGMRRLVWRLSLSALAFAVAGLCAPATPAFAQNQAVLILDHSNGMTAKIEGTAKVTAMRNTLGPLLHEQAGKLDLGVVAFGAQKAKSCEAIETLKAVAPIDPAKDAKTIDSANPKGSSPIAASLKAANGLFKTQTGGRALILVTGSADDCGADICAVAKDIKAQTPLTVIHIVAFGEEIDEKMEALSCAAEETSGVFTTAQSAEELDGALRKAFDLAAAGMSEDKEGQPVPAFQPLIGGVGAPGGQPATSNEPGTLILSAILAKDTPPLNSGLTWRIYDGRVLDDGSYRLLHRLQEPRPALKLTPGDYLVNAAYGRANLTKRLTVWPDKQLDDIFNLNAGGLRLYATLAGQPLFNEQSLVFDVFSEETDQFGNRRKVIAGAKAGVVMRLNGGAYRIESTYGDANAIMEADVTVEPGKLTEATIDHQAGKVTFRLVEKQGGEALADTIWQIFSDGQLVKRSGGAFPSHVLAAGSYEVRVEHSGQEFAAKFSVGAGDKKQVEVVMP
ncbi:MAG: hypothetical protein HC850_12165 [Rhodomicrobium sp.]|nr:hypothetical protein [Rhodomicrobium sp.]